ncbi:MAG: hypothetical protein FLDDKLPJ_02662 [Phycisphaerae bacterium]|nr:hypothetical protein [Phycisphaerae bacterium]
MRALVVVAVPFYLNLAAPLVVLGHEFTYQGQLKSNGVPAEGPHVMEFRLFDAASDGNQVGPTLTFDGQGGNPAPVDVAEGLFTVGLDFGAFSDGARWLDIVVEGSPITPRQAVTSAPQASYALGPWVTGAGMSLTYAGGNVGIGATTPGAKLQIDDGALRIRNNADNKNWDLAYDATENYFYVDEFGSARRLVIENGGNVGIGTVNPDRHLVVKSPVSRNESTYVQIDSGGTSTQYSTFELLDRGVVKWEVGKTSGNEFYVEEPGVARRFMIEPGTGYVGIGTTNPNRHLVVKSQPSLNENAWIQIDSGGTGARYSGLELMDRGAAKWEVGKTPSNEFYVEEPGIARRLTILPGSGDIELSDDASITNVDQIIGWNDLRFYGDDVGGPDLFIQPGGNIGIGTTTPGQRLTVNGIIETLGGIRFPDGTTQYTAGGGGGGDGLWTAVDDDIRNLNPGNVGIGVADPGSKLEVSGGVRALGGAPDGDPQSVNVGYAFENSPGSGMFAPSEGQVSLFVYGDRGMMVTPTGLDPAPAVHLGIDLISDALIQTGRLNVRGLLGEFSGSAITASGGDGFPAIRVDTGGDDAVGIYVQGSLGENSTGVHATGDVGLSGDGETYGVFGFGPTGVSGSGSEVGVEGVGLGFGGSVGVRGEAPGVAIHGDGGIGVRATGKLYAVQAELPDDPEIPVGHAIFAIVEDTVNDFAGTFHGNVQINGMLTKTGGTFRIDHPLDPENKTLSHSFVESPDMMNVYNGNVVTNADGEAWVELPAYFEALNRDFRYQLTVVDTDDFAQARVFRKVQNNVFGIKTDRGGVEVSWQITGIRQDPWAEQNRVIVEEDKPADQRGRYLNPEAYCEPLERSIVRGEP